MEKSSTKNSSANEIFTQIGSVGDLLRNISLLAYKNESFSSDIAENHCIELKEEFYSPFFSVTLAVPEWEAIIMALLLSIIIVLTIVGNILVILSVFTYKPLRIVQNFFIVSLAVADLMVALLVLPLNVAYSILGSWEFGIHVCKLWLTFDVMCCTSSILNLCAIALDRFWAITDPINYVHKRTVCRVLVLISGVWVLSFLISSPPLFGWNDWPKEFTSTTPCQLTSNRGYVVYSSLGSFFIPLIIMTVVYFEIYIATRRRLRERHTASKLQKFDPEKKNIPLNKFETFIQENFDENCKCQNFFCCRKALDQGTSSSIQDDKESFSSDTQANTDIKNEVTHKKVPTSNLEEHKSFELLDEACTSETPRKELLLNKKANEKCTGSSANEFSFERDKTLQNECAQNIICCQHFYSTKEHSTFKAHLQKEPKGLHQFIEEKQKISLSKERRAARTLGIIMGVFVICWLPFFLMYVILAFCETCCPTQKFKNFVTWLGYINSSLNPVIYTIFNLDYRHAFKRLLGVN